LRGSRRHLFNVTASLDPAIQPLLPSPAYA
jgi:hypothetical protein